MKKLSILTTVIILATAVNAGASEFYLGADLGSSSNSLKTETASDKKYFEREGTVYGIFAGTKLEKDLAIELGVNYFLANKTLADNTDDLEVSTKLRLINYSVDLVKSFEIANKLSIFGTVGASMVSGSLKEKVILLSNPNLSAIKNSDEVKFGYGIGGGVAYRIFKNVDLRAKIKYTKLDLNFSNSISELEIKDIITTSISLAYNF